MEIGNLKYMIIFIGICFSSIIIKHKLNGANANAMRQLGMYGQLKCYIFIRV